METLFAIGMIVGLMKPHTGPPRPIAPIAMAAPRHAERQDIARREAMPERPVVRQKSTWALDY